MNDAETQAYQRRHLRAGSRPWRWDPRETGFSHKKHFGSASPQALPKDGLKRPRRPVEDQLYTLRCGAYSAAVSNGYIRSIRFHPDWQAIKIGKKQGYSVDIKGSEPRACMSSLRDDGSIPFDASVVHLAQHRMEETANPFNYPATADDMAQHNRITAYLGVDDKFDYFDDIKWALFRAYNPATRTGPVVHAFGTWYDEWTEAPHGFVPSFYQSFTGWHAYLFVDWCNIDGREYLIAQNSYGSGLGDKGFFYFPREVVNREFAKWGSALKIPTGALTKEQIELAKQENTAGWIQRMILQAWYILSEKYGNFVGRYA
jgi:hypothetical protein